MKSDDQGVNSAVAAHKAIMAIDEVAAFNAGKCPPGLYEEIHEQCGLLTLHIDQLAASIVELERPPLHPRPSDISVEQATKEAIVKNASALSALAAEKSAVPEGWRQALQACAEHFGMLGHAGCPAAVNARAMLSAQQPVSEGAK